MGRYILVYTHPEEGESRIELESNHSYRLGSRQDNDIVVDQRDVSRHHAILRVLDGSFHITDLSSKNGTFVNGSRVVSSTFHCGDMINLSSARLVLVEVSTGARAAFTDASSGSGSEEPRVDTEDTQKYRGEATVDDMVRLLEVTSGAIRRRSLADPLAWALHRFGVEAALLLYLDEEEDVSIIASVGDLGPLVEHSGALARIAREHHLDRGADATVHRIQEIGEELLLAPVSGHHLLVLRSGTTVPAVGDLRALMAAVDTVLVGSARSDPTDSGVRTLRRASALNTIVGVSDSITRCKRLAEQFARQDDPVLITGPEGAGKSLFARAIHEMSRRAGGELVELDCRRDGSVGRLIGDGRAPGAAARAHGGTLVLREVGELVPEAQEAVVELLRSGMLPRRTDETIPCDVRMIVCSTVPVEEAALNEDLVAAFSGLQLEVPALRDRLEDLPILLAYFLRQAEEEQQRRVTGFTVGAMEALAAYPWPGNVRELRQEVMRVVAGVAEGRAADTARLAPQIVARDPESFDLASAADATLADARDEFERWMVRQALKGADGNQSRAAERLGISRAGLFKKMRKLGISA